MIGHHGIPDASDVFVLLLLFIAPSGLGQDCVWEYSPFLTTNQTEKVKTLKRWMLLDYQVSVPTNLKPDEFCRKLWDLYFIHRELVRMTKVAGENLTKAIQNLTRITGTATDCKIKENDCIHFEQRNVSLFLEPIPSLFEALEQHSKRFGDQNIDFSNCTIVQCQLDYLTTPVTKLAEQTTGDSQFFTTLDPRDARQKTEVNQPSQAASSRKHYWWLILLLAALLLVACVVKRRFQHRQSSQNLPSEPLEQL